MAALSPVGLRVQAQLDWPDFLTAVDAIPPAEDVLAAAATFLHGKCGFTCPEAAAGLEQAQMATHAEYPGSLVVRAFLQRALKAINAVQDASPATSAPASVWGLRPSCELAGTRGPGSR